jgi:hypothetical protein
VAEVEGYIQDSLLNTVSCGSWPSSYLEVILQLCTVLVIRVELEHSDQLT